MGTITNPNVTTGSGYVGNDGINTTNRVPKQDLGKDEFLQILSYQLGNQDPLSPMEDTDFIAQMAQFSSLEQMQEMNANAASTQSYGMIGKYIIGEVTDGVTGIKQTIEGLVSGVVQQNGTDYLIVGNYLVPKTAVQGVYDTTTSTDALLVQSSQMIGKEVELEIPKEDGSGEMETITGVVESIKVGKLGNLEVKLVGKDDTYYVTYIKKVSDAKPATETPGVGEETEETEKPEAEG